MHTKGMFAWASAKELPSVLLIDDDLVSREVIATLLTMTGYSVHTVDGGEASVNLVSVGNFEPGVILMDAQMPGLSGRDLIGQLRAKSKAPIYLISASQPPVELAGAADGFLLKPFNVDGLTKLLEGRKPKTKPTLVNLNEPVLNAETLAQFRKMMPEEAVRQIYTEVVADLERRIEALGTAIAKGDSAEVRRIGHAIKGGCGMAGAMQAARLGALLEADALEAKDNQLDNSAGLLRDLRAAAEGLERMLDAEMQA
jgi:CheY-like chemotaxis protein